MQVDQNCVITVDITSRLRSNETFALASQASQVYYAPSVVSPQSNIYSVITSKSRPFDESINTHTLQEEPFQETQLRPPIKKLN